MTSVFSLVTADQLAVALAVALLAGTVKGMVGFAMPLILVSGLGVFLPPDVALAGLILPTLAANMLQAFRQGLGEALASVRRFGVFMGVALVFLLGSAQLVPVLPERLMLLMIGVPVAGFAAMQLFALRWSLTRPTRKVDVFLGVITGFIGGLSGIWGPTTVMYLNALDTPKLEFLRVQGVIYGAGAVALLLAHMGSGVMRAETWPFSAVLVLPAMLGMWLGGLVHSRIDQTTFRKATDVVLLLAGLNLIRRALWG